MEIAMISPNPMSLLQLLIEKGADPDKLGKMMDLAERWQKEQSAREFAAAISGFQADCPQIYKRREAKGKIQFAYASYDDVMHEISPLLARYHIAVTFSTEPSERGIKIACRVRVGTHAEESTFTLPVPAGVVNDTQLYGQALSYGKRYALCAALNIVVTDEDNDSSYPDETLTCKEIEELEKLIAETGTDRARFLKWALGPNAEEGIGAILRSRFADARGLLLRKKNGGH